MLLAKLIALFVVAGGAIGGATISAIVALWALTYSISSGYFDPDSWASFVPSALMISLLGIVVGFPAAAATGSIYATSKQVRRYFTIAVVGGVASAIWGTIFAAVLASGRLELPAALTIVVPFTLAGVVASMACHRVAKVWLELQTTEARA